MLISVAALVSPSPRTSSEKEIILSPLMIINNIWSFNVTSLSTYTDGTLTTQTTLFLGWHVFNSNQAALPLDNHKVVQRRLSSTLFLAKHLYQRQFWLFSVCHCCLVTYFIWSKNKGSALKWCVISSRLTLSQLTSWWLMFRLIYVMGLAGWRIPFLSTYMPSQKLLRLLQLLIMLTTVCCRFGSQTFDL